MRAFGAISSREECAVLKRPAVQVVAPALTACGSRASRTPEAIAVETADAGSTFQSQGQAFTLYDEPKQTEQSGAAKPIEPTYIGPEGS